MCGALNTKASQQPSPQRRQQIQKPKLTPQQQFDQINTKIASIKQEPPLLVSAASNEDTIIKLKIKNEILLQHQLVLDGIEVCNDPELRQKRKELTTTILSLIESNDKLLSSITQSSPSS